MPINISEEFPDLLAQLTRKGDFLGIIDSDGKTLQMMYDADDDRYWIEIPSPENDGSYGCDMTLEQIAGLVEALPQRFAPAMLPGAEFRRWGDLNYRDEIKQIAEKLGIDTDEVPEDKWCLAINYVLDAIMSDEE